MGTQQTRTIFYFSAAAAVLFVMAFWPNKKGTSFFQRAATTWKDSSDVSEKTSDTLVSVSPHASPRSRFRKALNDKDLRNTYQPGTNYVNSYVPKTEYQHPLVASTTFVDKKDQKKNKAKKKKEELAKRNKNGKSLRQFGLSDSPDIDDVQRPAGGPIVAATTPANPNRNNPSKNNENEEDNLNSLEYWEDPIFVKLDTQMVTKLIESFQGKKVSSGIFYELVTEMRSDERVQVREFGLTALSATPSVRSFSELASMKHTDPEADLRSAAASEVANYFQETRLPHVISALGLKDVDGNRPTYEALVVLNDATKKYSGEPTTDDGAPIIAPNSSVEPRFEQALNTIEQYRLTESADTRVKNQAIQTVDSLQKFVSGVVSL